MALFSHYGLQTAASQRASIAFRDGTVLHLDARSDVVLNSPHMTQVRGGQVDEELAPGANHQVQTSTAVATAIGTNFLVRIVGQGSYFMVLHGAALIHNALGSVVVKSNQGSLVLPGQAPQPAYPIDAGTATDWIGSLPNPNLGENIALDTSGGRIVGVSSDAGGMGKGEYGAIPYGAAANLIDGRLDAGWESASGTVAGQWVKVGFSGDAVQPVSEVIVDPATWASEPTTTYLKDFEIRVSTATTDAYDFHVVLHATCRQSATLQHFKLPSGTSARYVQLVALSNYGSPLHVGVAELEVVSPPQ
jgi:hypothetical protein